MSEINLVKVGSLNLNFNQADPKKAFKTFMAKKATKLKTTQKTKYSII